MDNRDAIIAETKRVIAKAIRDNDIEYALPITGLNPMPGHVYRENADAVYDALAAAGLLRDDGEAA